MKIAGNLKINDWREIEKVLKPNEEENWGLAFHFFEERIRTRYLNPIKALLDMDLNNGEGFAVVNLQCSLIEMIESFVNGWVYIHKPRGWYKNEQKSEVMNNACIFKSFFANRNGIENMKIDGGDFYDSVRCGLLHETQTKSNWKITKGLSDGDAYEEKDGFKIIYRDNFQRDLGILIKNYKKAIINGVEFDGIPACELRENFIAKFNHICKVS